MSWAWTDSGLRVFLALTIGVSVLIAGLLREHRMETRKIWRYLVVVLVAVSLVVLILQARWSRRVDGQAALLLTRGADLVAAGAEIEKLERGSLSAALPGVEPWSAQTTRISDLATWIRNHPEIAHLRVVGDGLEPWDLEELPPTVEFLAVPDQRAGLRSVRWQRDLTRGDRLVVAGSIGGTDPGQLRLDLAGPDGTCDSTEVVIELRGPPQPFSLQCTPPGEGRFLYQLKTTGSTELDESSELVDVRVGPGELPSILWLQDAPSFEARHFKRWIESVGGQMALRSRVSRDRYHFEFSNRKEIPLRRVVAEVLREFDLIVVEERAWSRLAAEERSAIRRQVEDAAVGLLIRLSPDRTGEAPEEWPLGFSGRRIQGADRLVVNLEGQSAEPGGTVETGPFQLVLNPGETPLAADRSSRILAAARSSGEGTVGVTLLHQTYPWVLAGEPETHQDYWRQVIESLARPSARPMWHLPAGPVLVDEPLDLELDWISQDETPPEASFGPLEGELSTLALRQDANQPARWTGRVWPSSTGWHRLSTSGATVDFLVAEVDAWSAWQQERRTQATRLASLRLPTREDQTSTVIEVPFPRMPFVLTFLMGVGLLWLDERR